jgi:hypothetical protein
MADLDTLRTVPLRRAVLLAPSTLATTYVIPDDYSIVCLDVASGRVLLKTTPAGLPRPRLRLLGPLIFATPRLPSRALMDPRRQDRGSWLTPSSRIVLASSGVVLPLMSPPWPSLVTAVVLTVVSLWSFRRRRWRVGITAVLLAFVAFLEAALSLAIPFLELRPHAPADTEAPPALQRRLCSSTGLCLRFDPHNTRDLEEAHTGRVLRRLDWFPSDLFGRRRPRHLHIRRRHQPH